MSNTNAGKGRAYVHYLALMRAIAAYARGEGAVPLVTNFRQDLLPRFKHQASLKYVDVFPPLPVGSVGRSSTPPNTNTRFRCETPQWAFRNRGAGWSAEPTMVTRSQRFALCVMRAQGGDTRRTPHANTERNGNRLQIPAHTFNEPCRPQVYFQLRLRQGGLRAGRPRVNTDHNHTLLRVIITDRDGVDRVVRSHWRNAESRKESTVREGKHVPFKTKQHCTEQCDMTVDDNAEQFIKGTYGCSCTEKMTYTHDIQRYAGSASENDALALC